MIIGVPKEIKIEECRVALTPKGADTLIKAGHRVFLEKFAGKESGFLDEDYEKVGAEIVEEAQKVWQGADMIIKIKEPQESEFGFLRPDLILFTYLHLASFPELTNILQERNVTSIGYATVELEDGFLPLLSPMSEVAGKLAVQKAAQYLEKLSGGKGVLISGTKTVEAAKVLVLGGGVVGSNSAKTALGLGAKVFLIEKNPKKCKMLKKKFSSFGKKFQCFLSSEELLNKLVKEVDIIVGGVLVAGAKAPKIISEEQVKTMKLGSVIVDVAIDQGGCIETSRVTSHKEPVFVKHGVIHYCVPNMPGIVPLTSTLALTRETLPYILQLANKGFERAVKENSALAKGVNVYKGKIIYQRLAEALNKEYIPLENLL